MVAQIGHLPEFRHVREQAERFLSAEIVEGFQNTIAMKGTGP